MPQKPLPDALILKSYELWKKLGAKEACKKLDISENTLRNRLKNYEIKFNEPIEKQIKKSQIEVQYPPDPDISIEDLIAHRKKQFQKRAAHEDARKLISVKVSIDGPIGILHYGDPHIDDDGCDIGSLERHRALCIREEGLFAANVGDTTNNWIGRLARLYADQGTTAAQAWKLAEWFIDEQPWLYMLAGNHDAWSGAGDPLIWISRQAGALYQSSEARLALKFKTGREVRINARHDFAGSSQWNPAHGPGKAVLLGERDHIAICGHKHKSGYMVIKDPVSEICCHAIQVSSYKLYDRYARDRGFRDQHLSPCVVTTINPSLPDTHPDMIKVFWDAEEGVDFLRWLRGRRKA